MMTALKPEPGRGPPPPAPQALRACDPGGAGVADAGDGLGFPDVPRLELDQLLEQLVERADDVRATQGRLRGLLRAYALVASDLRLPVVLRHIVTAARELLGARYAALGVLDRDGGVRFLTAHGAPERHDDRRAARGCRAAGKMDRWGQRLRILSAAAAAPR